MPPKKTKPGKFRFTSKLLLKHAHEICKATHEKLQEIILEQRKCLQDLLEMNWNGVWS